ncbi:phenylacetate-CoA oxygenase subunit PaaJ [Flavobacteriales bacterium]|nr:phenylacetate-CoA oxygenase subunit PaaJ [Flavobacteriales bacterium]
MQNGKIDKIWKILGSVPDPEIPVISVVELGVIRDVQLIKNEYVISVTPTYSGCPAVKTFQDDIKEQLKINNINNFKIEIVYKPAWTTDWMTKETKEKLRDYGISPPEKNASCPQCNSKEIELISEFGATACKSMYKCNDCLEPFEHFKCI